MDKQKSAIVWVLDEPQSFQNIIQQAADLPGFPAYLPCSAVCSSPPAALTWPLGTSKIAHHPQMRPLLSTIPRRSSGCSLQPSTWMVTSSLCGSWSWDLWCSRGSCFGWCWETSPCNMLHSLEQCFRALCSFVLWTAVASVSCFCWLSPGRCAVPMFMLNY